MTAGLVIGAAAFVFAGAMFIFIERLPLERLIPLTCILVVPAFVIGLAIAPTLIYSIHITGEWVVHRIFDKWVMSRARASDFISMESPSGIFAATLRFSDGTKMRVFGAHRGILASLDSELQRLSNRAEQ